MEPDAPIFIAGHRGMVGSACVRVWKAAGYHHLLLRTREELDLCDQQAVRAFYRKHRPRYVIMAAAKVGGIAANQRDPVGFLRENLAMADHVIGGALEAEVERLVFVSSSSVYPRLAPQPMCEEMLLTGPPEPTNQAYAMAKLAGMELCRAAQAQYGKHFFSVLPTNLYGPGDRFDPESGHVIPSLLRKFGEAVATNAPTVTLWGSGTPHREFLHVDDLAEALLFLMRHPTPPPVANIGCGVDLAIAELASLIAKVTGFKGEIVWDRTRPDGAPRKWLDVSRMETLGWRASRPLEEGLAAVYQWWREQPATALR